MPREFNRTNWPEELDPQEKELKTWTTFFLFVWASLFLTATLWLTFWVLESENVVSWTIPWWKCGILSYCLLVITGISRATKRQQ